MSKLDELLAEIEAKARSPKLSHEERSAQQSLALVRMVRELREALEEVVSHGHSDLCMAIKDRRPGYRCHVEEAEEALANVNRIAEELK